MYPNLPLKKKKITIDFVELKFFYFKTVILIVHVTVSMFDTPESTDTLMILNSDLRFDSRQKCLFKKKKKNIYPLFLWPLYTHRYAIR